MDEVQGTSAIEGERLDRDSVRSSVARHLGLERAGLARGPRRVDGLVHVLLDATRHANAPVTLERVLGWHASLFPDGWSGPTRIRAGALREGDAPMQVVSGALGSPIVHFEAPPSARVPGEVRAFLDALTRPRGDALVHATLVHLRFVTIHPFDDGNGRLARALTDLALARADGVTARWWSLSAQIERERPAYYAALQAAQRGDGDVTAWIVWHLGVIERAIVHAESVVDRVIAKVRAWDRLRHLDLNVRQRKIVDRLLEACPDGFVGGMTTRKAASLTGASRAPHSATSRAWSSSA